VKSKYGFILRTTISWKIVQDAPVFYFWFLITQRWWTFAENIHFALKKHAFKSFSQKKFPKITPNWQQRILWYPLRFGKILSLILTRLYRPYKSLGDQAAHDLRGIILVRFRLYRTLQRFWQGPHQAVQELTIFLVRSPPPCRGPNKNFSLVPISLYKPFKDFDNFQSLLYRERVYQQTLLLRWALRWALQRDNVGKDKASKKEHADG
jgi:hypothetical protein